MKNLKRSLLQCLLSAVSSYDYSLKEEQGGFILKQANEENYEYVPILNSMSGTERAIALYVAVQDEFNSKVALRTLDDEWEVFASYHTHPLGMRAMPSSIDLGYLFTSFPVNFIYAPDRELNRFDYIKDVALHAEHNSEWKHTPILQLNGYTPPIKQRKTYILNCNTSQDTEPRNNNR